jgi:glycerophosphoryl diester phosphodiesterase
LAIIGLLIAAAPAACAGPSEPPEATLEGRAVLPADTFADGPPSGAGLDEGESKGDRSLPFEDQPVGGISAVLDAGDGEYLAMTDNGFGNKGNSADFLLRVYRLHPDFETASGGSGEVSIEGNVQLRDPDRRVPFQITNEESEDRLLTGTDFDIESVRQDRRGDLWFGDEFGPFLLHTDKTGRMLDAPIPLPNVKSPENPDLTAKEKPNLATGKGFEGMAISKDANTLYPILDGTLEDDPEERRRLIYEFDLEDKSYTGERWKYRVEALDNAVGELTALDADRFLVVENDTKQGEKARFKKIYLVDLSRTDSEGFLTKQEVLDLLSIHDPDLISKPGGEGDIGLGDPFAFPFATTESVLPLGGSRLLIVNDNNYPKGSGRNPGRPDDTEMIIVRSEALEDDSLG